MRLSKLNWLIFFILLAVGSICFSLFKGPTFFSLNLLFNLFSNHSDVLQKQILMKIRLPRTLSAFVVGGLLSVSGCFMQLLLRNPLADPYVLGISGGAAVCSLLAILWGLSGICLTLSAWIGSLMAIFMVFFLSKRRSGWHPPLALLTGIALASGFSAIISFILIISPNRSLHSMLFWLLGDLSFAHLPLIEGSILIAILIFGLGWGKSLNLLSRGEQEARTLGVNTASIYCKLYFLSALLTACAVALAGCIGFVGLVVPHMIRLLCGSDHRFLIPACLLVGGSLVTLADTFARTLFFPLQLPVGILMAFIGIPVFLFLIKTHLK